MHLALIYLKFLMMREALNIDFSKRSKRKLSNICPTIISEGGQVVFLFYCLGLKPMPYMYILKSLTCSNLFTENVVKIRHICFWRFHVEPPPFLRGRFHLLTSTLLSLLCCLPPRPMMLIYKRLEASLSQ